MPNLLYRDFLIFRSLHAMSVKKCNADDTPNFEKLEDVIANEVSPACPVLSKSTMNLLKFNS